MRKFAIVGLLGLLSLGTAFAASQATWIWTAVTKDVDGNPEQISRYELELTFPDGTVQTLNSTTETLDTSAMVMPGVYSARIRAFDKGNAAVTLPDGTVLQPTAPLASQWSAPVVHVIRDNTPPATPEGLRCNS